MKFQCYIFSSLLLILLVQGVHSTITVPPSNAAAVAGTSVTFLCTSNIGIQSVTWSVTYNSGSTAAISNTCDNLNPIFESRCEIIKNSSTSQCDLKFFNVTEQDAGVYTCNDGDFTAPFSACAYLAVFASDTSCSTNSSTYAVEDEMVLLSCNANGYSYLPAAMSMNVEWSGAGCPNETTTGNFTFVSSSISIAAKPPTVQSCNSTIRFTAPGPNQFVCATNEPTYAYTWSSPLINVSYCPNVTLESISNENSTNDIDTVICYTVAYPSVSIISMTDGFVNEELLDSSIMSYKLTRPGNLSVVCTATNYLYGNMSRPCSITSVIDVHSTVEQDEEAGSQTLSAGAIAGIAVAGAAGVTAVVLGSVYAWRKNHGSNAQVGDADNAINNEETSVPGDGSFACVNAADN